VHPKPWWQPGEQVHESRRLPAVTISRQGAAVLLFFSAERCLERGAVCHRQTAAGDQLRIIYDQLSKDPNSLSNLDQDLPNYAQHQVGGLII
jgi:hypothetical protein